MSLFVDSSSNFHPYECDGPGKCAHCDRAITRDHVPAACALCEGDGGPPVKVRGRGGEMEDA